MKDKLDPYRWHSTNIKRLMDHLNLTPEEFAEQLPASPITVRSWLRQPNMMYRRELDRMARESGFDPKEDVL